MSIQLIKVDQLLLQGTPPPIKINKGTAFMAGGAVRRWFKDEKLSDVDLFFTSEEQYRKYIEGSSMPVLFENPRCATLSDGRILVQCIKVKYHPTIESVLDAFDFSVCQFGFDGEEVWATPEALVTVLRGGLAVHTITQEFAVDSLRRAFKYAKKGFFPCNGSIQKLADSLRGLTAEQVKQAVEISPNGGLITKRVD